MKMSMDAKRNINGHVQDRKWYTHFVMYYATFLKVQSNTEIWGKDTHNCKKIVKILNTSFGNALYCTIDVGQHKKQVMYFTLP